jgi:hypothetical protein
MPGPDVPKALTEAPTATVAEGFVLLDHPDGLALTLTPGVAAETGHRLIAAASEALEQGAIGGDEA